jgi:hypothetical protein
VTIPGPESAHFGLQVPFASGATLRIVSEPRLALGSAFSRVTRRRQRRPYGVRLVGVAPQALGSRLVMGETMRNLHPTHGVGQMLSRAAPTTGRVFYIPRASAHIRQTTRSRASRSTRSSAARNSSLAMWSA